MTDLMISESSTLVVAQNSQSIECDRFEDKLLMVPKPENQIWIPILVDKKNGDYIINVSPEENKIVSLIQRASKDEDEEDIIRIPVELLDQLTEEDEQAIFKFTELMIQFSSGIDSKIFNSISLATLLILLKETFAIEYVFLELMSMSTEEMEKIITSSNPVSILILRHEEEEY